MSVPVNYFKYTTVGTGVCLVYFHRSVPLQHTTQILRPRGPGREPEAEEEHAEPEAEEEHAEAHSEKPTPDREPGW
jgi:hypothetical protein